MRVRLAHRIPRNVAEFENINSEGDQFTEGYLAWPCRTSPIV